MKNIVIIFLLLLPFCTISAQSERREVRKGNKEYNKGSYGDAELHYRNALEKNPDSENANYNLANALYKQNQFEPAITKYETLTATEKDKNKLAKYYYNLGNAYFKSQKLDKCIDAYKKSLLLNPKDVDAKHNLFLARMMQKQQQQQQQQNQDNKDQNQDNKENKNNKQDQQDQKDKQSKQDQQNQDQKKDQQQKGQEQQISKQDAERLLEALEQDEKNVMKKVQEEKASVRKIPVEKEW